MNRMSDMDRVFSNVIVNPESEPFWAAAQDRRLLLKTCRGCGKNHFYPRSLCPFCFGADTAWVEASGEGTLYAHSTLRRGADTPYTLAYVTLAEGPRALTNMVECDGTGLRIGQPVRVVFKPTENGMLVPMWAPA